MKNLIEKVKKFNNDESGDIVQTCLIIGILAVIALGGLKFISPKIKQLFDKGGAALDDGNGVTY